MLEQAADLMQPLGTVKRWVRRGLVALKDCLERATTVLQARPLNNTEALALSAPTGPIVPVGKLRT